MKTHSYTPYQVDMKRRINGLNISNFIRQHGIAYPNARKDTKKLPNGKRIIKWTVPKQGQRKGNCIFLTVTLKERVYKKEKAEKLCKSFIKDLKAHTPFQYCCVPERHESGAYHFHFIISLDDKNMSLGEFEERYKNLRFIGLIKAEWTWGPEENVIRYLTQYLTVENMNSIEGRCVSYSKRVQRVANYRCASVNSGWRRDWNFMPMLSGCTREQVIEYYHKMSRRDRHTLVNLHREKKYESMGLYVKKGVESIIRPQHFQKFIDSVPSLQRQRENNEILYKFRARI